MLAGSLHARISQRVRSGMRPENVSDLGDVPKIWKSELIGDIREPWASKLSRQLGEVHPAAGIDVLRLVLDLRAIVCDQTPQLAIPAATMLTDQVGDRQGRRQALHVAQRDDRVIHGATIRRPAMLTLRNTQLITPMTEKSVAQHRISSIKPKRRVLADLIAELKTLLHHNHPDRPRLYRLIPRPRRELEPLSPQEENLFAVPWRPAWPLDYRGR
jgi:hypothetical protein